MNRIALRKTYVWETVAIFLTSALFGYIAGLRSFGIGLDFLNYQYFYDQIRQSSDLSYFRYEPGFVFLTELFASLSDLDYTHFAALLVAISLLIKFYVLKRIDHAVLTIIFYLCVWFPLHENTQIRLGVALAFIFLASEKLFESRWIWFVLLSVIASTFHITAASVAAGLAAASFLARYPLRYSISLMCIGGAVLSVGFDMIMMYAALVQPLLSLQGEDSANPNIFSGFNILSALFLLFFAISGGIKDYRARTFFLATCFGFIIFLAFLPVPVMAQRFKELFMVFITFISFNYRLNLKTLPQASFASLLAGWSLYSAVDYGLFSG